MRVAYTLEQCWHAVPGGTAVAALETARALGALDVDLVGVSAWHRSAPPSTWRPPIAVRAVPLPRRVLYETWLRLRRPRVERTTGPVDVVHATTIITPPTRAPLVVTIHDLAFVHEPEHFTRHGAAAFRRGLDLARRRAAVVLCSSRATLADCLDQGFAADRVRHVPLGVRVVPVDEAAVERVRKEYELPDRYLLFTGTIEPRKNLPSLLAAVARLDDALVLVVAGPPGWGAELGALADRLGPRVRRIGFVPQDDLRALYGGCLAFCYPSTREGFGLPVLEAMAQGAPVVTSRGTATEEAAGDAGVLVDPFDVDDIARGIAEAVARAGELSERARARAAAMSWDETATHTLAAYHDAVRA